MTSNCGHDDEMGMLTKATTHASRLTLSQSVPYGMGYIRTRDCATVLSRGGSFFRSRGLQMSFGACHRAVRMYFEALKFFSFSTLFGFSNACIVDFLFFHLGK